MNIGILTYYRVANFGANLQAVSTYYYLKNNGYNPLFILYESDDTVKNFQKKQANEIQRKSMFTLLIPLFQINHSVVLMQTI